MHKVASVQINNGVNIMKKLIISILATSALASAAMAAETAAPASGMPDQAAMQRMAALTTPGENHKVLGQLVGSWDYTISFKMAKDAPEQTSTGSSENMWILDGRFLQQKVSGVMDMGGQKQNFNGIATIGYDNGKREYQSTWMDNMNTGLMTATGQYDATTKTLKEGGEYFCPIKNSVIKTQSELQFVDENHFTYTTYDVSGETYKSMEIRYTRKK